MKNTKWFGLVAWLVIPALSGYAQTPEAAALGAPGQVQVAAPANLSPGAAEVVRLASSGVGDDVVLAYIRNSQAPFNLSADDVLYLKDIGLSADVTSAMLTHDTSLRGQQEQYAPAATTPAPAAPAPVIAPAPSGALTVAAAPAPVYVSSPPPDVAYFYNDLAPYGTWVQLDGYGWCWQPTAVVMTRGWRPYGDGGHWVYSDLGWYWQSTYSWGWAPFHYGRWYSHPRCGWVWTPDRVWGPAWVTWRSTGDVCGWAPLPPRAEFDVRLGWRYNGVSVGASFGFGLGSDAFLFVGFGDFFHHDLHRRYLPPARVTTVYHQTTIINNYVVDNNRIVHRGIPLERVSAATRGSVPRATVRDWSDRPDRMPTRSGSVVYRPRLEAPARPGNMMAQRLDAQQPVIRHTPSAPPRSGRPAASAASAASGRSAWTAAATPNRSRLESPKTSPWTSAARPASAPRVQSAPSTSQPTPAAPAGRERKTSDWSGSARPATSPQVQSPPTARQTTPATPVGRPQQTSTSPGITRTTPPPRIQSAPSAPPPTPAAPASRAPQTSRSPGNARQTPSPQVQAAPSPNQSPIAIPPGPAAPRAPENWKQGARLAPGYRSDAGLPALLQYPPARCVNPCRIVGQPARVPA